MRICAIGLRGFPNVSGGIETHCGHLYPRLAELRPTDTFYVCGRVAYIGRQWYDPVDGVTVVPVRSIHNKYLETISNTLFAIFVARFRLKADVIHLHAIGPGLLAPLAVLLGMRVIMTHHGDDFRREKWNRFAKFVLRMGERVGVRWSQKVLVVSQAVAERLRREVPSKKDRIHYIPNGADHILSAAYTTVDAPTCFGLTPGDYLVSVGRLVPEKGFEDLIRAHEMSGTNRALVIVGGDLDSAYGRRLKAMAGPNVIFTGNQPPENVASLVASAGLFVLASHHEGLPIVALEASALGTPVLVSDIAANLGLELPMQHYFTVGKTAELAHRLSEDAFDLPQLALSPSFRWQGIAEETSRQYDLLR